MCRHHIADQPGGALAPPGPIREEGDRDQEDVVLSPVRNWVPGSARSEFYHMPSS